MNSEVGQEKPTDWFKWAKLGFEFIKVGFQHSKLIATVVTTLFAGSMGFTGWTLWSNSSEPEKPAVIEEQVEPVIEITPAPEYATGSECKEIVDKAILEHWDQYHR